jgi:hypothetical protein
MTSDAPLCLVLSADAETIHVDEAHAEAVEVLAVEVGEAPAPPARKPHPRPPAPPQLNTPADPLDPRLGGWFDGPPPDTPPADPLAAEVVNRLATLRELATELDPGTAPVEDALRGLARAVALARALEAAEHTGARSALLGKIQTPDTLADLAAAKLDRSTSPLLAMALQRARASGRGAAGPVDKLTRQVQTGAKQLHTRSWVSGAQTGSTVQQELPVRVRELTVPHPWTVNRGGIQYAIDSDDFTSVTDRWLVIVGRSWTPETGEYFVDLMWPTPGGQGGTTVKTVPRAVIGTPAALRELAAYGAPLCQNPQFLVGFLGALESANDDKIPTRVSVRTMGWAKLPGNVRVFVLGSEVLGTGGEAVEVRPMEGAEAAMAGWGRGGTAAEWSEALADPLQRFPVLGVFYLAALASPLLEVLDRPSFFVDLAGDTSTGKSTALELAASVWGSPDGKRGVFKSWDATAVGLERTAETLGCLPVLLDDTKLADKNVAQNLYRLASGQGKIRGRPDGLRKQGSWRTLVISTGEAPVTERSEDGGTRARVLSLTDPPFPGLSAAVGREVVQGISSAAHAHYGHAGRAMALHLAGANWTALRTRYSAIQAGFVGEWADSGVSVRLGSHAAVLLLAAEIAGDIGLPVPDVVGVETLLRKTAEQGAVESDRPRVALASVLSWIGANPGRIFPGERDRDPPGGWLARNLEDGDIAIVGDSARTYLADHGHDVASATRAWGQRGWLDLGDRSTRPIRFGTMRVRCYRVRSTAVAEVMDGEGVAQ